MRYNASARNFIYLSILVQRVLSGMGKMEPLQFEIRINSIACARPYFMQQFSNFASNYIGHTTLLC